MEYWACESPLIFVAGLPLLVKWVPHSGRKLPLLVKQAPHLVRKFLLFVNQVPPGWILPTGGSTKRSLSLMTGKTDLSDEEILEKLLALNLEGAK
jgi:hypothetical protein